MSTGRIIAATSLPSTTMGRLTSISISARGAALLIFLAAFALYAALTPYVVQKWWLTGDEPHYLVVAHSLVYDGDLDLRNNYLNKDFVRFYIGEDLGAQVPTESGPPRYSPRAVGLAVVLAPAYALGGRLAVTYILNIVAALLAASTFLVGVRLTGRIGPALVATMAFALTPPWFNYAFLIYPELWGGLLILWGVWGILRLHEHRLAPLGVGCAAAALPWLNARFVLYTLALAGTALAVVVCSRQERPTRLSSLVTSACRRLWASRSTVIALSLPMLLSVAGLAWYGLVFFGSPSPLAGYASAGYQVSNLSEPGLRIFSGLFGWLFDQRQGLFFYAPLSVIALPGLALAIRTRRPAGLIALPVLGVVYLSVAWSGFWQQWSVPPRYLVAVLPLLAIYAAVALARVRSRAFWLAAVLCFVLALSIGFFLVRNPLTPYRSSIVWEYARRLPASAVAAIGFPSFYPEIWIGTYTSAEDLFKPRTKLDPPVVVRNQTVLLPGRYRGQWGVQVGAGSGPAARLEVAEGNVVFWATEVAAGDTGDGEFRVVPFELSLPGFVEPSRLEFRTIYLAPTPVVLDHVISGQRLPPVPGWLTLGAMILGLVGFTAIGLRRAREPGTLAGDARTQQTSHSLAIVAVVLGIGCLAVVGLALPERTRTFTAADLTRGLGRLVEDRRATAGSAVFSSAASGAGLLAYGPYEFLPAGHQAARFRVRRGPAAAPDAEIARIEVVASAAHIVAKRSVLATDLTADTYEDIVLPFRLGEQRMVEFRLYATGAADVWFDRVSVDRDSSGLAAPGSG